jgi:hypothetical protein
MSDYQLLIKNISQSAIIPNHYAPQILVALGGKLEMGDPTSKQGGTNIREMFWENGDLCYHQNDILAVENLLAYCKRNKIFYTMAPVEKQKKVMAYVATDEGRYTTRGATLAGVLAAALIGLRHFKDSPLT